MGAFSGLRVMLGVLFSHRVNPPPPPLREDELPEVFKPNITPLNVKTDATTNLQKIHYKELELLKIESSRFRDRK